MYSRHISIFIYIHISISISCIFPSTAYFNRAFILKKDLYYMNITSRLMTGRNGAPGWGSGYEGATEGRVKCVSVKVTLNGICILFRSL